jgi:thiopeptide-type bacteriocin biosynthesis protein
MTVLFQAEAESFVLARIPLLPITDFLTWRDAAARGEGNGWLEAVVNREEVYAAIEIASPSLARAIDRARKLRQPFADRTRRAVTRYVLRMASRSTPFGLFAGTVVGEHGREMRLVVGDMSSHRVFARLTGNVLTNVIQMALADEAIRSQVPLRINSSAYTWGGRLHFIEALRPEGSLLYRRATAVLDEPLRAVIETLRMNTSATRADAIQVLVEKGFEESDARSYIELLIAEQIILPSIALPVVSDSPLDQLMSSVRRLAPSAKISHRIGDLHNHLASIATGFLPDAIPRLNAMSRLARECGLGKEEQHPCDVQLRIEADICLDSAILRDIETAANILALTNRPAVRSPHASLARELDAFCHAFGERFGDAAVPLAIALDPEIGVGFRGAGTPGINKTPSEYSVESRDRLLMTKVVAAMASGHKVITLKDTDIELLASNRSNYLPPSAIISIRIAIDQNMNGYQIYAGKLGGPDATIPLGRFASGDERLTELIQAWQSHDNEHFASHIDAEIIHLAGGNLAGIVGRPRFREFEIAYMGVGQAEPHKTLTIDDLLVSVQGQNAVIYSRSHQAVVRPHLTCAHAAHHPELPAAYRFLFAVALQNIDIVLTWKWGPLDALAFLPRVQYRNIVLSLAQWRLSKVDLNEVVRAPARLQHEAISILRSRFHLPRFVAIVSNDDELAFDLENPEMGDAFASLARRAELLILTEVFPDPLHSALQGMAGGYMHEIMVPLRNTRFGSPARPVPFHSDCERQSPEFLGGPWLYFRIGAGAHTAEDLLLTVLAPQLEDLMASQTISGWFFVRYRDPQHHIRLRIQGDPEVLLSVVLPKFLPMLRNGLDDGTVGTVTLDTYRPEINRYGGMAAMPEIERLFFADSIAVVRTLGIARADGTLDDPDHRMTIACLGAHWLFETLVPDSQMRPIMIREFARASLADSASLKRRRREFASAFRRQRATLMEAVFDAHEAWDAYRRVLSEQRSTCLEPVRQIAQLAQAGALTTSYVSIIGSLLHMHLNRVFVDDPRRHEEVVYDFLHQLYRCQAAREISVAKER